VRGGGTIEDVITLRRRRRGTAPPPAAVAADSPADWEPLARSYCAARLEIEALRGENAELRRKLREAVELGSRALADGTRAELETERLAAVVVDGLAIQRLLEDG